MIRFAVMIYVRYHLSLRNVEDLLFERGIDICHETVLPCPNPTERREVAIGLTAPRKSFSGAFALTVPLKQLLFVLGKQSPKRVSHS